MRRLHQLGVKEVDPELTGTSKVVNMRETAESKSFFQTLKSYRIILCIVLIEVCDDSLNIRRTILWHVFTNRREVAIIVTMQTACGSELEDVIERARYRFHDS